MKIGKVEAVLAILIGALMAIGPWTFVHVCKGMEGMPSPCHTTRWVALALGIIILLLGVLLLKTKSRGGTILLSLCLAVAGVVGILTPTVLAPVCEMATMHCRTHTRPFLLVISGLLIVLAVATIAYLWGRGKPSKESKEAALAAGEGDELPRDAVDAASEPLAEEAPKAETSPEETPEAEIPTEETASETATEEASQSEASPTTEG